MTKITLSPVLASLCCADLCLQFDLPSVLLAQRYWPLRTHPSQPASEPASELLNILRCKRAQRSHDATHFRSIGFYCRPATDRRDDCSKVVCIITQCREGYLGPAYTGQRRRRPTTTCVVNGFRRQTTLDVNLSTWPDDRREGYRTKDEILFY